jgi:diaminopimelate epimerase
MGQAKVGEPEPDLEVEGAARAVRVDVGNPHVVLEWAPTRLPDQDALVAIGSRIDAATPGGANVEVVRPTGGRDAIDMVVFERGVGPTQACGTGACAAAAAAHEWGLVDEQVTVTMPGGPARVDLGDPVLLTGEVTSVARVEAPWP